MNIALIVMVVIVINFLFKTINRLAKKPVIHPSWIDALDVAIVVGAVFWFLVFFNVISV